MFSKKQKKDKNSILEDPKSKNKKVISDQNKKTIFIGGKNGHELHGRFSYRIMLDRVFVYARRKKRNERLRLCVSRRKNSGRRYNLFK